MKISNILFRAREIQLKRGRAQHQMENDRGNVCMLGALWLASGNSHAKNYACQMFFGDCLGVGILTDFSDYVCKTVDDMAAAFEIAACCAAAEGL